MDLLQSSNLKMTEKKDDSDSDGGYDGYDGESPLPFNLEFFTQCHDLRRLVDHLESSPMDFVAGDAQNAGFDEDPRFDYREDPEYREAQRRTRSSNFHRKYRKLHDELSEVIDDFGLLSFLPLSIQDAESVGRVVARIDKSNGYVFLKEHEEQQRGEVGQSNSMQDMFSSAMVSDSEWATGVLSDVQEKYLGEVMFQEEIGELSHKKQTRIKGGNGKQIR